VLEQPSGDVGRRAEERGLPEGKEAGVAEQQVQAEAEDGEDPDLGGDHRTHDQGQHTDRNQDECKSSHRIPNIP
jgi:hypothetical protein